MSGSEISAEHIAASLSPEPKRLRVVFRSVFRPQVGSLQPLRTSDEGRWATDGTLYTASSVESSWAEYCRNHAAEVEQANRTGVVGVDMQNIRTVAHVPVGDPLPRRAMYELNLDLANVVDLRTDNSIAILQEHGFDTSMFVADSHDPTSEVATAIANAGWDALIAPSAAWRRDSYCVAVFQRGLEGASPRLLERAASPTVVHAFGTYYKAGQRPAWLGPQPLVA